jgi:hypothetical protein
VKSDLTWRMKLKLNLYWYVSSIEIGGPSKLCMHASAEPEHVDTQHSKKLEYHTSHESILLGLHLVHTPAARLDGT